MVVAFNAAEVRRTLDLFCGGNVAEVRIINAFGSKSRTDAGYFSRYEIAAGAIAGHAMHPKNSGIYFVLNEFAPDLQNRASNRIAERIDSTASDADITRRRWFFIDCDPKRPAGISSSDAEWMAAKATADAVALFLASRAFPAPIMASSGNGWHLHYRIDVPNNEAATETVRNALRELSNRFSNAAVTVDTKVFNAARVCKLYGTVARKGDHSTERPHRVSELVSVPETIHVCDWSKIEALAADAPKEKPKATRDKSRTKPRRSIVDRAAAYLQKIPPAVSGESGHDVTFHAACVLVRDFDLSIEDALPILAEWNERCVPPWSDRELLHKLQDADKAPGERGRALQSDRWEPDPITPRFAAVAIAIPASAQLVHDPDPIVIPEHLRMHKAILDTLGIIYCAAEDTSSAIEIFSDATRKFSRFKDPSAIKSDHLVLAAGHPVMIHVQRTGDDSGQFTLSQVKLAIASVAAQTSAVTEKRGVGVWESGCNLVIVSSRQLGILNGSPQLSVSQNPVFRNQAYDVGDRCEWIDMPKLAEQICGVGAQPGKLHVDDVFTLQGLFAKWTFRNPDGVIPEVLTGLVMASFVQTLWRWRPQVFLIGQAYAGKTTMMHALAAIFGALEANSAQSSAAGIRQALRNSGRIPLCDELEKNKHRPEIFEMIRSSGRGDEVFRGTAGQHGHVAFKLQHIFWCASIESGLLTEADSSRFIVIELQKTNQKIDVPDNDTLDALGRRLAASAIVNVRRAREVADYCLARRPDGVHGRVCESYAVPVSMYAVSVGMSETEALALFLRALDGISESDQVESDAESLLHELMLSQVQVAGGRRLSLASALESRYQTPVEEALEAVGVIVEGDSVLFNKSLALRYLLTHDWKGKRIDQILSRIPGVSRVVRRSGKTSLRYICIPRSLFGELKSDPEPEQASGQNSGRTDPFGQKFEW
jgi:hypothetical protein